MNFKEMNNMLYHIREMLVWGNIVDMIDGDSLKRYTNGHIKQKDMILSSMGESHLDRLKEIKLINDSNRLDGVVIQKPAGIEKTREEFECEFTGLEEDVFNGGYGRYFTCKPEKLWAWIEEQLNVTGLIENGEGYAEGIGQTLEATKRTEKMLLDECCKALGWQGGTIHQVKNVLSAAKRVKLVHDEVELSNDWDKFKAAIVTLKAVV